MLSAYYMYVNLWAYIHLGRCARDVFKNFCLQGKFVLQGNLWAGQQML